MIEQTFTIEVRDHDEGELTVVFVPSSGGEKDRRNAFHIPLKGDAEGIGLLLKDFARRIVAGHVSQAQQLLDKLTPKAVQA